MKAATKQKNGSGGVIGLTKFETESGNIRQLGYQCDLDLGWSHLINIYIYINGYPCHFDFVHAHPSSCRSKSLEHGIKKQSVSQCVHVYIIKYVCAIYIPYQSEPYEGR